VSEEDPLSTFVATLHTQVDQAQQALAHARQASDDGQVHRYGARLLDLLDRAAAHGVNTTDWVPRDLLSLASSAAGNES
jgi:hypothetical protein